MEETKVSMWLDLLEKNEGDLYIDSINTDSDITVNVVFFNTKKKIKISFHNHLSYRVTDESYLLEYWHRTSGEKVTKPFSTFKSSSYIKDFKKLALTCNDLKIKHYCIFSTEDCIEVLATKDPAIENL